MTDHKPQSKKYQFLRAHYAPLIARQLYDPNATLAASDFLNIIKNAKEALTTRHRELEEQKRDPQEDPRCQSLQRVIQTISAARDSTVGRKETPSQKERSDTDTYTFDAFALLMEPTLDRTGGRDCKYLKWICESWLATPVRVEDMYKIKESLNYFDHLSGILHRDSKPNEIDQIAGFDGLNKILAPYEYERERKRAERKERSMPPEVRAKLNAETTVVYDGPEGKIIIPHTMESCQYWGNQTKWCISAEKRDDNLFYLYNEKHSIFIYLPKPNTKDFETHRQHYKSFKFAAVDEYVFDEKDKTKHSTHPECLYRLAKAVQNTLTGPALAILNKHALLQKILKKPTDLHQSNNDKKKSALYPQEWLHIFSNTLYLEYGLQNPNERMQKLLQNRDFILTVATSYTQLFEYIPDKFKKDEEIVMAAIKKDSNVLKFASKCLRANKDFIMKSVQWDGSALVHADKTLQDDKEVVMVAVQENGFALQYASDRLRNDIDVVTAAIEQDGYAFVHASEELRGNKMLALKALSSLKNSSILNNMSEDLQEDIDINIVATGTGHTTLKPESHPFLSQFIDIILKIQEDKKYLLSAVQPNFDSTNETIYIARRILENGYGLSSNFAPEELRFDPTYITVALRIAQENGTEDKLFDQLRHMPMFWGDFDAITSVKKAIEHVVQPRTSFATRSKTAFTSPVSVPS